MKNLLLLLETKSKFTELSPRVILQLFWFLRAKLAVGFREGKICCLFFLKKLFVTGPPWPKIRVLLHEDEKWASFCRWNKFKKHVGFEEPSAGLGYIFRVQWKRSGKRCDFGGLRESKFYPRFKQTFSGMIRNQETFFSAISVVWTVLTNSSINWNKQTQHSGKFTNLEMDFPLPHFSVPESPKFTQENLGIQEPC